METAVILISSGIILVGFYIFLGVKKPAMALVSSPFVSAAMVFTAIVSENTPLLAVATMIFVATMLAISLTAAETIKDMWVRSLARWLFMIVTIVVLTVLSFQILPGIIIIPMLFFMLAGFVISYTICARQSVVVDVVSTIGACMRQNLPLATALAGAARQRTDKQGLILGRVAQWLERGFSLSDSLKRGYPRCPGRVSALIAMGERADQVPTALKAIEKDLLEKAGERMKVNPVHPLYPFIVLTTAFFIGLGLMLFIVPKLKSIFADMGATLPRSTRMLIAFYDASYGWILGLLVVFVLIVVPWSFYLRLRPRQPDRPQLMSWVGDFVKWHLPIFRWFEKNYSLVQIVESLRLSLRAGCTVDKAIDNTLGLDVNLCFRRRLRKWLDSVTRGEDTARAAGASGLGRPLVWAFDSEVNRGNTPAILEILEDFYRSNYSYRVILARHVLWPIIIVTLAVVVGFMVYAFFSPVVEIIEHTAVLVMP